MPWVYLFVAGLLEIAWAYYMKRSEGFTLLTPSVITIVTMIASFALLSVSMRTLPLGTAYTIWTGIGAVGAFVVGIAVLGEPATPMRLVAGSLIVAGIVMMRLSWNVSGPGSNRLTAWEMFKVYDGQIHMVEAYIRLFPPELDLGGWPLGEGIVQP